MKRPFVVIAAALVTLTACEQQIVNIPVLAEATNSAAITLTVAGADVVMSGLNNPRGLAFGPDGALFVAEAGRGGTGPCFQSGQLVCYGPTGAIGRYWRGKQDTVVTGLPSYANAAGRAEGPNGISLLGMGGAYVSVGWEADPSIRTQAPELARFARLVHIDPSALTPAVAVVGGPTAAHPGSAWEFVRDLGTYELQVNPDCGRIDSNPFAVLAAPGGVIVADAGANALIHVATNGELSTFAAFPSRYTTALGSECPALPVGYPAVLPSETVPTSIAIGPDGAYYVGHLAGFPLVVGAANIYRVVPGSAPEVFLSGFTFVISLAFDRVGNLYVLQHQDGGGAAGTGSLVRVTPAGARTVVINGLTRPTGLAIDKDDAIYISHRGTSVGTGQVLRIQP